jgi:hypothetical protein
MKTFQTVPESPRSQPFLSFSGLKKFTFTLQKTNERITIKNSKKKILKNSRHALPLFTSLVNIIFSYDPIGYGLPYNYLMFTDSREILVEVSCQLLCVVLESSILAGRDENLDEASKSNLFINYISRIHRDEVSLFSSLIVSN